MRNGERKGQTPLELKGGRNRWMEVEGEGQRPGRQPGDEKNVPPVKRGSSANATTSYDVGTYRLPATRRSRPQLGFPAVPCARQRLRVLQSGLRVSERVGVARKRWQRCLVRRRRPVDKEVT